MIFGTSFPYFNMFNDRYQLMTWAQ